LHLHRSGPRLPSIIALSSKSASLFLSYLTIPLCITFLGSERYGLWMVANSTMAFSSFLDFGITPTLKNRMAEAFARGEKSTFEYYASFAFAVSLLVMALGFAMAILVRVLDWAAIFNANGAEAKAEGNDLVSAMILCLMASLSLGMIESIYYARLEILKPKLYALGSTILSFVVLIGSIYYRFSLPLLVFATGMTVLVGRLLLVAELMIRDRIFPRYVGLGRMLSDVMSSSLLFSGIQLATVVISFLPAFLLARLRSLEDVTVFSICFKLVTIPLYAVAEVLPVYWPRFTMSWARGEIAQLKKQLIRLVGLTCGAAFTFALLATMFGNLFILRWTSGIVNAPMTLMVALGIWLILQTGIYWLSTFLHSISDFRFELACYWLTAILLVVFSWSFVGKGGFVGLAWSMVLSSLIGSVAPMVYRVKLKLSFGQVAL